MRLIPIVLLLHVAGCDSFEPSPYNIATSGARDPAHETNLPAAAAAAAEARARIPPSTRPTMRAPVTVSSKSQYTRDNGDATYTWGGPGRTLTGALYTCPIPDAASQRDLRDVCLEGDVLWRADHPVAELADVGLDGNAIAPNWAMSLALDDDVTWKHLEYDAIRATEGAAIFNLLCRGSAPRRGLLDPVPVSSWAPATTYTVGDRVTNGGDQFQMAGTLRGDTGVSGQRGPSSRTHQTGDLSMDGDIYWLYVAAANYPLTYLEATMHALSPNGVAPQSLPALQQLQIDMPSAAAAFAQVCVDYRAIVPAGSH